jgi:transcriptional regulator with XRE-family HTH domain
MTCAIFRGKLWEMRLKDLAKALIAARTKAGLTQEEVAERMKTSQSFVARGPNQRVPLGERNVTPTWKSLQRYAHATGTKLRIELEHA